MRARATNMPLPLPPTQARPMLRYFLPLAIAALVAGIYVNAVDNPFVLEATDTIVNNPDVAEPQGLVRLWSNDAWGRGENPIIYRPLTVFSYHLNARLTGLEPVGFRIVNMALLATLGCALAIWISRFTRRTVAWLAAALVVAHPSHTEAINLIVGRADILSMIGVLGVLYCHRRAIEQNRWSPWRIAAALGLACLAIGAKETGVIVIPLVAVQAWVSRPKDDGALPPPPRRWGLILAAVVLLPAMAFILVRLALVGIALGDLPSAGGLTDNPLRGLSLTARLPAVFSLVWLYAQQIVWPDTSYNLTPGSLPRWGDRQVLLGVTLLLLVLVMTWSELRRRGWLAVPLMMAVGQFVVVGHLLVPSGTFAANRLMIPFLIAVACAAAQWLNGVTGKSLRRAAVAAIPCAALVAVMGWCVFRANPTWQSDLTRYQADADRHPNNPVALYNLGSELLSSGQAGEATPPLEEVVRVRPDSAQARQKLARAYLQNGDSENAAEQFQHVIARYPDDWRAHLSLAETHLQRGQLDEAEKHILAARNLAPAMLSVMNAQATLAAARGQDAEAMRLLESILLQDPAQKGARKSYEELKAKAARPGQEP